MVERVERDPIGAGDDGPGEGPSIVVVAPSLLLEIAVERSPADQSEIHVHPGGQGFWVARMAARLGARVRLCTTIGGESGDAIAPLVERSGIDLEATRSQHSTPALIEDRRGGDAREIATTPVGPLGRHDVDELFAMAVAAGLGSDAVLVTGPRDSSQIDPDFYRRLIGDLRRHEASSARICPGTRSRRRSTRGSTCSRSPTASWSTPRSPRAARGMPFCTRCGGSPMAV